MLRNMKYAFKMLGKNPAFTTLAICSLAIGIGANSAIFSVADALLLRPLPVMRPSGVVTVNPGAASFGGDSTVSYPDYLDLRDRNRSFDGLIAFQYGQFGYAPNPSVVPEMQFGVFVSGNFFRVLGVEPTEGRGFRASEDKIAGRDRVAVISHDFWLAHFNGALSAIGSKMRLNGIEFTVIGVAPAAFTGVDQFVKPAIFLPIAMSPALSGADNLNKRDARWLNVKGRLKPGVTNARAEADLNAIAKNLQQMYPSEPHSMKIRVETELALRIEQSPPDAGLIEMLTLLARCVLLVACANVAGLLLSRATARGREIAIRLAVGAARWQLVRQLFLENLLLALGGGILGIAVAIVGIRLFASIPHPTDVPISFDISLDRRVLVFTLIVSVASTFLFGLMPAWRSSRSDVASALRARDADGTRKARLWGRNVLVSSQLAISCVLLIVSAVIFLGFRSQLSHGPGFQTDHLFLMSFDSQMVHYSKAQNEQFYKQLLNSARSTPGIRSAALASMIPFGFGGDSKTVLPEGRTLGRGEELPTAFDSTVSDGYFETIHIPILRGRGFLASDKPDSSRIAVVNEHFANRFWPHQDAIGKRFHLQDAKGPLVQIVGIARQAKYLWIAESPSDFVYLPFSQNQQNGMTLLAESPTSDASTLAPLLRRLVHGIDPNMPAFDVRTMQDLFTKRAIQTPNIILEAVAGMGIMALILAVIGLYGLIAYSVSRRTREIGIRMAIGADRRSVLQMILRQGLVLALAGTAVGLVLGIVASRLVGSMFILSFGGTNPALFLLIMLPLLMVALLAAYTPARRASRIDPMRALREE
ncbi:MAG: ABC transporter permease [Acidobacteriota bacterium]|nr:ABC transporter permease [Acidobacteriota bacterium]